MHRITLETDFDGYERPVIWCNRQDFSYDKIKRQAEYALWQEYSDRNWVAVRYPVVLGMEEKTGKKAILLGENELTDDIDKAPYNGEPEFSINTDKAKSLGFKFSDIHDWIYDLLDYYISEMKNADER